jgi:hypothetical protein
MRQCTALVFSLHPVSGIICIHTHDNDRVPEISSFEAYLLSSLSQLCIYGDSELTDEASGDALNPEALTPADIKANTIAKLSSTNPRDVMTTYSETIRP